MKKVSIVVVSKYDSLYLERCLHSIFEQTYQNIELLVFYTKQNQLSRDNLQKELDKRNCEYLLEEVYIEQTLSSIYQEACRKMTGEYVLFLTADHFLISDYIEKMIEFFSRAEADITYTSLSVFGSNKILLPAKDFSTKTLFIEDVVGISSMWSAVAINKIIFDDSVTDENVLYDAIIQGVLKYSYNIEAMADLKLYTLDDGTAIRKIAERSDYIYLVNKYKKYLSLSDLQTIIGVCAQIIPTQENSELLYRYHQVLSRNKTLQNMNKKLKSDVDALVQSKSYRIGQLFMKPMFYAKRFIKATLDIKNHRKRLKILGRRLRNIYFVLFSYFYKVLRNHTRSNNYGTNAKRVLVFNIFESAPRLLQYKLHFLKALSVMVERCLIVVNGELSELDQQMLSEFGEVIIRPNEGYDTAAFREGILRLGKETLVHYDQLLLVNDTNVGPFYDFEKVFESMPSNTLDFWGLTRGEVTPDFTGYNPYGYIPDHLQSYFLVIENSLLKSNAFYKYWEKLTDTNSRDKAIGKHETVFTKHFSYLGYKYDAFIKDASDSAVYLHPMKILAQNSPIVKFTTFANFDRAQILWGGLDRKSEWPELMAYIEDKTDYPMAYIDEIMHVVYEKAKPKYVLLVDGVENVIPQCTRYRVENKAEELRNAGFTVKIVNASQLYWGDGKHASHIIIYRAGMNEALEKLIETARETGKPIFYDIDDLVFDTAYTDKLAYTQQLSAFRKAQYDGTVNSYHDVLVQCDGAIGSTQTMVRELQRYVPRVVLNRNKASQELVRFSQLAKNSVSKDNTVVRIGYFSGSITHNENFDVIKDVLIRLMETYPFVQLHVVGHLDIPESFKHVKDRVIVHPYVSWEKLPELIAAVDINVAPLAYHVFNEAKSEIKWIEAALVGVPTVASKIGAFKESIRDKETGLLVVDGWYEALESLVLSPELRAEIGQNAYEDVMAQCTTDTPSQQLVEWLQENE